MTFSFNLGRVSVTAALLAVLTCLCPIPASQAETLYQQSLGKLERNLQKASPQDYSFVVLGDNRGNDQVFTRALKLAAGYNPLFILHQGDVSDTGSEREVDHFLGIVRTHVPDVPVFVVPGNHEQKGVFVEKVAPLGYAIDSARLGLRVVVADNSDYRLQPSQLKNLAAELDASRTFKFVAMHIPPATPRWKIHTFSEGAAELMALAAGKGVSAVFYGHIHLYDRADIQGVPHIISGGAGARLMRIGFAGDPVYHVVLVKVKEGKVTCTMIRIPV